MNRHLARRGLAALVLSLTAAGCGEDATAPPAPVEDATAPEADAPVAAEVAEPPAERVRIVPLLEDPALGLLIGRSRAVAFEVPEGAVAVTISVVGARGDYHTVDDWRDGASGQLVNENWLASPDAQQGLCLGCANRVTVSDGAFATLAPNNPAATLRSGPHSVRILGFRPRPVVSEGSAVCGDNICHTLDQFNCQRDCGASPINGRVAVQVLAKVADDGQLPAAGVLDLNLHFTGAQGLTAATAQADPAFQGYLATMRDLYAQVGVSLGELSYHDIDSVYATIESFDGPDADLSEMFALSVGKPDAVNLFFVNELSAGQFGAFAVVLGISGGIPGPPRLQGSPRSGVAIALKPVDGAPAGVATTMAHEVGHFLGLFHTSEQSFFGGAAIHDPLPDTSEDDDSWLMFNTGAGSRISAQQGAVMRANPWIRHPEGAE